MTILGLTGGIASGKSTVSTMLGALGACVIDADLVAREVVAPGSPGLAEIREHFGDGVLAADGSLDRKALGAIVFADAEKRAALNAIVHPRVFATMLSRVTDALAEKVPLIVLDVPLLFESARKYPVDATAVVYVDPATQLARLMARDGSDEAAARARIEAQMALEEKRKRADHVIDNTGDLEHTRTQVEALVARLKAGQEGNG